jgi:hypothetical protein
MTGIAAAAFVMGQILLASGTLVVAVPTRDGLVVAADSRWTLGGPAVDVDRWKLQLIEAQPPTAFTITGHPEAQKSPPRGVSLKEWLQSGPREFDGMEVVRKVLLSTPPEVTLATLTLAVNTLASSNQQLLDANPRFSARYRDKDLCHLVVFQATGRGLIIGSGALRIDNDGRVVVSSTPTLRRYQLDQAVHYVPFGVADYLEAHVWRGVGRRFLPKRVDQLLNTNRRSRDLTKDDGWFIAKALINATEQTMSLMPPPPLYATGGPVRGYLITSTTAIRLESLTGGPPIVPSQ